MYTDYIHWHYVSAPYWLLEFFTNVQRWLWQYFSVPIMLRTLFAHWRRDRVSYRAGSIQGILLAWAWNIISRGMGTILRTLVLMSWLVAEAVVTVSFIIIFIAFMAWPLIILTTAAAGFGLLIVG